MTAQPVPAPLAHPNPGGARPVERIDETLEALRIYWLNRPDLRLGQIVCNLATNHADPHLMEDAFLLERLRGLHSVPQTRSRYVPRTAQRGARRIHVFHDVAGLLNLDSFAGNPLCSGPEQIERRYYSDDQSIPFSLDPAAVELDAAQITCDRCWSHYLRIISGRTA